MKMKICIIGAGTIGLTYSWLLSSEHDVTVYVRPERLKNHEKGYSFDLQDLRDKSIKKFEYTPNLTTSISSDYDAILVMVNRMQLANVLPLLHNCTNIIFMLNHWNIDDEVRKFLLPQQFFYGFPSQVGGGIEGNKVDAVVFNEGTILGESDGASSERLTALEQAFTKAGLSVEIQPNILDWLKVHYLQQSITAGVISKAGGYYDFARDYRAVKEMVYAFREGLDVCEAQGVSTKNIFPAKMFRYPAFFVAVMMKSRLNKPETIKMITGHMKRGMPEWIVGFDEILADGDTLNIDMSVWHSYKPYVDKYLQHTSLGQINHPVR